MVNVSKIKAKLNRIITPGRLILWMYVFSLNLKHFYNDLRVVFVVVIKTM
jgi:hypothetical protein